MKTLFLIVSLSLCAGICQAQFLPGPTSPLKITGIDCDTMHAPKPIYDTIPVILLVCDTVQYTAIGLGCTHREPAAFWLRGYKVNLWVKKHDYWNMVIDEYGKQVTGSWQHHTYLDNNKKRLNYLVWDAREVKK